MTWDPNIETRKCGTCKCVTDGGYSEWCPFTSCSVSCGGGVRYRNRTCTNPPPQNGGMDCRHLGPARESQKCNTQSCNQGNYTEWTNWSECSATCGGGAQIRSRTCTNPPPKVGGKDCKETIGPAQQSRQCDTGPCPTDGNYTEWTKWSDCSASCAGGLKTRVRTCTNPSPQNGGKSCIDLGSASETAECNPDPCPIDGNYTEWTKWSDCGATCGGGSKTRTRFCTNPTPSHGGKNCDDLGPTSETVSCNPDPCPIDGNYTEWTEWSDCTATCGGGSKTRIRTCTNPPPQHGGNNCVELGPDTETVKCSRDPCPIDGNYTEWTTWSDCSETCGGGSKTRTRTCTNPLPQHSGKNCSKLGPASQTVNCSTDPCPIDGNYTEWTKWSDCSATCGGGSKTRVRACTNPPPQHGGKNCIELGPASATMECSPNPCPIDGNYTEWTKWSDCSATCGNGSKTRIRSCTNPPPQYGGDNCVDLGPDTDITECNLKPCIVSVFCENSRLFLPVACVAGAKRGGGGGREKGKSPSPFSLPSYPLPPTPFDTCYAGYLPGFFLSLRRGGHTITNCALLIFIFSAPPCAAGLDIGLVVDKSKSINKNQMKLVRESLVKLVDSFNPAPDKDHFGLITFNNKASVNFKLNDKEFYDKYQLEKRIGEMSLDRAYKTRTDLAMNAARDELFTSSGGDRPDKPNVMIVLTDGKPQGLPKRFSFEKFSADFYGDPKVTGLYTVAVGIGKGINHEVLRQIAGEQGSVFATQGFDELAVELPKIKKKLCGTLY
ncbi:unnamed protein product [Porites lobata]|uniref:VWFA domain-containing protein n=1 Tax=Porites lobata TaxID=104759 RepID=A0ABN8R3P0_9CNID|nr:unnamed protein product [Porites lobata]